MTPDWAQIEDQDAYFGWSVGTAGDVNGDGYDDIIVGADSYTNDLYEEGKAFVYHGSASGLSTTADWTAEGDQLLAYFGRSVGTAGDVNGDGYDRRLVKRRFRSRETSTPPAARSLSGSTSHTTARRRSRCRGS
jgi:hypothetical protein